jgi:hypothetical protein
MKRWAITLGALMLPVCAAAETIEGTGWRTACNDAFCEIVSQGFILSVVDGGGTPPEIMRKLRRMADMTSVQIAGEISNMGDMTADLVLTSMQAADDVNEGNLQFMQGDWAPVGEEGHYFVRITGLYYQEWSDGEMSMNALMSVGDSCANGTQYRGTVISLYPVGGDPSEIACWGVDYVDEETLELRDYVGEWGLVEYARVGGN